MNDTKLTKLKQTFRKKIEKKFFFREIEKKIFRKIKKNFQRLPEKFQKIFFQVFKTFMNKSNYK